MDNMGMDFLMCNFNIAISGTHIIETGFLFSDMLSMNQSRKKINIMPSFERTTHLYKSVGHIITFNIQSSDEQTSFLLYYEGTKYILFYCMIFRCSFYKKMYNIHLKFLC